MRLLFAMFVASVPPSLPGTDSMTYLKHVWTFFVKPMLRTILGQHDCHHCPSEPHFLNVCIDLILLSFRKALKKGFFFQMSHDADWTCPQIRYFKFRLLWNFLKVLHFYNWFVSLVLLFYDDKLVWFKKQQLCMAPWIILWLGDL